MTEQRTLIIGAGIAGLSLALRLSELGRRSHVVSKARFRESSSYCAQGGIAAPLGESDSVGSHVVDTVEAGAGLVDENAARVIIDSANCGIEWLEGIGVAFTKDDGGARLHLTREAGHRERRVVHVDDCTGKYVIECMLAKAFNDPLISLAENTMAVDLLIENGDQPGSRRCVGAVLRDQERNVFLEYRSQSTCLATGGASGIYSESTNPYKCTGDGIALGWGVGCELAGLEFVQFHPTRLCAAPGTQDSLLISEAVRGEGGKLRCNGRRFMTQYDERLELAPRDIVARAISFEMTRNNVGNVELDVSHLPSDFVERRFPTISRRCRSLGLDLSKSPIPVAPAAHFSCGGLVTNLHGETTVAGLFALGECATVGLHGANRLASNSLTEAIVMAERTASRINSNTGLDLTYVANIAGGARGTVSSECTRHWQTLRATMSEKVGIVRTRDGLSQAITEIEEIRSDVDSLRRRSGRGRSLAELENGVTVALLTARAASARQESVGCHYLASPQ